MTARYHTANKRALHANSSGDAEAGSRYSDFDALPVKVIGEDEQRRRRGALRLLLSSSSSTHGVGDPTQMESWLGLCTSPLGVIGGGSPRKRDARIPVSRKRKERRKTGGRCTRISSLPRRRRRRRLHNRGQGSLSLQRYATSGYCPRRKRRERELGDHLLP